MRSPSGEHRIVYWPDVEALPCALLQAAERWRDVTTEDPRLPRLRAALATLTDKQREAVELHFFEGLSQGEIARRLGVSQQVVQRRLYGARRGGRVVGGALPRLRAAMTAQAA
ncbi:MAG: sigma-70 family RNA polymerase sigma factor [Alphaproteobacteria bacterium]|nr:sigma-70 family RNA polymerase sigma factor [Alphaproteobacteria bacterium]